MQQTTHDSSAAMPRAACPHYPACGGCQTLEWGYDEQLRQKQATLEKHFSGWPGLEIRPIVPSPSPVGYRHKVLLPFGKAQGQTTLGCFAKDSHLVVDQLSCAVQEPELTQCALAIKQWARAFRLPVYDEGSHTGLLRHAVLRKAAGTGQILAGLVVNAPAPSRDGAVGLGSREMAEALWGMLRDSLGARAGALRGLVLNVNAERTNVALGAREEVLIGSSFIDEELEGLRFRLRLGSFFQVNPLQAPRLFNEAVREIQPGMRVLDLYAGAGTFTLWAARQGAVCEGWEENVAAVQSAQEAAAANGLAGRVHFMRCDVTQRAAAVPETLGEAGAILVDPPRKGLERQLIEALVRQGAHKLVYVSCNPHSLKRDLEALASVYKAQTLQPVDMMPQTRHIEAVVHLVRR